MPTILGGAGPNPLKTIGPLVQVKIDVPDAYKETLAAAGENIPDSVEGSALIDTGARICGIDFDVISKLDLRSIGTRDIVGLVETVTVNRYFAKISFKEGNRYDYQIPSFTLTSIIGLNLTSRHPRPPRNSNSGVIAVIGRDLLRWLNVTYNGPKGRFSLEYKKE